MSNHHNGRDFPYCIQYTFCDIFRDSLEQISKGYQWHQRDYYDISLVIKATTLNTEVVELGIYLQHNLWDITIVSVSMWLDKAIVQGLFSLESHFLVDFGTSSNGENSTCGTSQLAGKHRVSIYPNLHIYS